MKLAIQTFSQRILFGIIALAVALCIVNAYVVGKMDGRDTRLIYGVFNDLTALSIAISEDRYGFHEGYIGRPEVIDALGKHLAPDGLMTGNQSEIPRVSSRESIEAALQEATTLDPKSFKPFKSVREPFVIMGGEDTGLVNFYRLAFALFGYHADAMYHLYFLLLAGSCVIFLVQARNHLVFAGTLLALMFGFQTLFYLDTYLQLGAPTVYCNRNIGTLGLVATLHIMLFPFTQNRYASITPWLLFVLQLVLLLFVITIRSSSMWQWLTILAWLIVPLIYMYFARRKSVGWLRAALCVATEKKFIFVMLAVILYVQHVQTRERMDAHDDIYFTNCTMPQHLRWHSAYLGFYLHPEWEEVAPSETGDVLHGDGVGWNVARTYWARKNPDSPRYVCKRFSYFPLFGVHDMVMRKAFFKFAGKHPQFMAELYFHYKPQAIYKALTKSLKLLPDGWWGLAGAFAAMMAIVGLLTPITRPQLLLSAAASLSLLFMANMPAMFAYPSYMAETLMMLLASMAFIPALLAAFVGYGVRQALLRGKVVAAN